MGPFVEMEEEKRSVCLWCARFPVIPRVTSQGNFPGLLKSAGPLPCGEKGRGAGPGWS